METVLTPRLLFDDQGTRLEGGWFGMVEMTPWRVQMLGHIAHPVGRAVGLTARLPMYSSKGVPELAGDGTILAGTETLLRLIRNLDAGEPTESVPVLLRTADVDDRAYRACRISEMGADFDKRYIDPLVTDAFPGMVDAHNIACAVRGYINWEDFGLPGMLRRNGWPAPSRLIGTIRDNHDDIVRYRDWAAMAKTRYNLGLKLPLAIMLVQRYSSPARVDAFWRPIMDGVHPLDPDSPQRWMLEQAAAEPFDAKRVLRLLVTAWNRWMRMEAGGALPLDDLETDLIF